MELMELLKTRRTYRRFDESRAVPREVLDDILTAQRYASSAANAQNLRYLVVQTPELVKKVFSLTRWAAALPPELGVPKEGERPTLFILVLCPKEKAGQHLYTDAGLAISNMTLAAWGHGVGSCVLANIDHEGLYDLLDIDPAYAIHTAVAFGYPTHRSSIVEPVEGKLGYYLDKNKDYCVPKLTVEETVMFR